MHGRNDPSFFLTNSIGAPHGDELGRMNPFSINYSSYAFNSFSSLGVIQYGALEIGCVPGKNSIVKSAPLRGGNPGSSSGKTSWKSRTTGTSDNFLLLPSLVVRKAR